MNKADLLDRIHKDQELDFIATCMVPFHVVGTIAALMYLHSLLKNTLRGIILIQPHNVSGNVIDCADIKLPEYVDAEIISYNPTTDEMFGLKDIRDRGLLIIREKPANKTIYIISVNSPWFGLIDNINRDTFYEGISLTIADGFATPYKITPSIFFGVLRYDGYKNAIHLIKKKIGIKFLTKINQIKTIDFSFAGRQIGDYGMAKKYYQASFEFEGRELTVPSNEKAVIFCNMPKYKDTENDHQKKMMIIIKILKRLQDLGYSVYLKNHPREDNMKLKGINNITVIPAHYPIEEVMANMNPKPAMTIAVMSSSVITAAACWEIESYLIYDLMPSEYWKRDYKNLDKWFKSYMHVLPKLGNGKDLLKNYKISF